MSEQKARKSERLILPGIGQAKLKNILNAVEEHYIILALSHCENFTEAAKLLGVTRTNLHWKRKRLGIKLLSMQ